MIYIYTVFLISELYWTADWWFSFKKYLKNIKPFSYSQFFFDLVSWSKADFYSEFLNDCWLVSSIEDAILNGEYVCLLLYDTTTPPSPFGPRDNVPPDLRHKQIWFLRPWLPDHHNQLHTSLLLDTGKLFIIPFI